MYALREAVIANAAFSQLMLYVTNSTCYLKYINIRFNFKFILYKLVIKKTYENNLIAN